MKARLTFTMPDEREAFEDAVHGGEWNVIVQDMDNALRNWLKYGHEFKSADEALEAARTKLNELVSVYNLEIA
jgi:hypothetical protein